MVEQQGYLFIDNPYTILCRNKRSVGYRYLKILKIVDSTSPYPVTATNDSR
jgi:hypothetical protein